MSETPHKILNKLEALLIQKKEVVREKSPTGVILSLIFASSRFIEDNQTQNRKRGSLRVTSPVVPRANHQKQNAAEMTPKTK
jgi:hypothetical protein